MIPRAANLSSGEMGQARETAAVRKIQGRTVRAGVEPAFQSAALAERGGWTNRFTAASSHRLPEIKRWQTCHTSVTLRHRKILGTARRQQDQLVGRIQERYGVAKTEAEKRARVEGIQARTPRRHATGNRPPGRGRRMDETDPSANRGSVVQVDARSADVAFTRPVRVPDMRAAPSGVLGTAPGRHAAGRGTGRPQAIDHAPPQARRHPGGL